MPQTEGDNSGTPPKGKSSGWIEGVSNPIVFNAGGRDLSRLPNGAEDDLARFADVEAAREEHEALDWNALAEQFPSFGEETTYPRPSFTEFVAIAKAGAAQLHAEDRLKAWKAKIAEIEAMDEEAYAERSKGKVAKDTFLKVLRGRSENETHALATLKVSVPLKDTPSMLNRGLTRGTADVSAKFFTGLQTARAIYEGSDFKINHNYTLPQPGFERNQVHLAPIDTIVVPRQPQPARA